MEDKIRTLLAQVLNIPATRITEDFEMRDADAWDSLKHMEFILAIEEAFEIQLTFDEIVAMRSFGEITRVLEARGAMD